MKSLVIMGGVLAAGLAGAVRAQVTQSYSYDANGRLVGVDTTDGVNTHTSTYAYDDAHNRTSRSQLEATKWAEALQVSRFDLLQSNGTPRLESEPRRLGPSHGRPVVFSAEAPEGFGHDSKARRGADQ